MIRRNYQIRNFVILARMHYFVLFYGTVEKLRSLFSILLKLISKEVGISEKILQ
jgi:hypothetical protein